MQTDIRESALYRDAEALYCSIRQPGTGQVSDASEIHASPDERYAVFAGLIVDRVEGAPSSRICRTELTTGDTQVLTFGPNTDRLPKYSPDGRYIAFLSDRNAVGDFQLYLLDSIEGVLRRAPSVEGWVEYLHWSPNGKRILLGVAGHGADISGGQGAVTSSEVLKDEPSWMPRVESGSEDFHWRRLWLYDLETDRTRLVSAADVNIWEAVWCGNRAFAAVVSMGPAEGLWYSARLCLVNSDDGTSREMYQPQDQIGCPAASPSGNRLAIVEAVCSDRGIVAGNLRLLDTSSGHTQEVDSAGVDVTHVEWRSDERLLLTGHRGFETVVGLFDVSIGRFSEVWSSGTLSTVGFYATASGCGTQGDCVLVSEGFAQAPEIAMIRQHRYQAVRSFDLGYSSHAKAIQDVKAISWQAPDGLQIQGWLLLPRGEGPHPLIMNVHGGPVWHWHPVWLGRRALPLLMLISRGYAIFLPNPRGSTGRGQDFARRVVGDMGGADTQDYLSGLDHLVALGIADAKRLGVTGMSYGGFMTAWLTTQDSRFAAAVPLAPVTNFVTEHLISNIPHFVAKFLADAFSNSGGKYSQRSPIMYAHKAKTPTLIVCGALDRCTPPAEAVQFHNALLENSVPSVLVTYPQEGHGIRSLPAAIDYAARVVAWFQKYIPAQLA